MTLAGVNAVKLPLRRLFNVYRVWVRQELLAQVDGSTRYSAWLQWIEEVPPQAYSDQRVRAASRASFRVAAAVAAETEEDPA